MLSVTPDPVLLHHLLLKARGDSSRAKLALKKLLRVLAGSKNSSGEKTQGDKYLGEGRGMQLGGGRFKGRTSLPGPVFGEPVLQQTLGSRNCFFWRKDWA